MIAKVGAGTHSEVFKAVNQASGELVALKKILIRKTEDGMPKEFIREVESLQRVLHDNVIKISEIFVGETNIYIAFPLFKSDLEQQISHTRHPFTRSEIVHIMKQITKGLQAIHECGLVHRDLKPSNVLIQDG